MTLDARQRPDVLQVLNGGEERVKLQHGYDLASNLTSITDTGDVTVGADTRSMYYDGLHRLTSLSINAPFVQDFTNNGAQSVSVPSGALNRPRFRRRYSA